MAKEKLGPAAARRVVRRLDEESAFESSDNIEKSSDSWRNLSLAFAAAYGAFALTEARDVLSGLSGSHEKIATGLHVASLIAIGVAMVSSIGASYGYPLQRPSGLTAYEVIEADASRRKLLQIAVIALGVFLTLALTQALLLALCG